MVVILFFPLIGMAAVDPVYPFSTQQLVPMPPFIEAGTGLNVNGLQLGVNTAAPIVPTTDGALTLDLGSGLTLVNGKLTSSSFAKTVPPITLSDSAEIGLKYGQGLTVDSSGALTSFSPVAIPPISLSNNTLSISLADTFSTVGGTLTLNITEPIYVDQNGNLGLQLGSGLSVVNGLLTVLTENLEFLSPLLKSNSTVKLQIGNGLAVVDNRLVSTIPHYTFNAPFQITNDAVSLNIGTGLRISNNVLETTTPTLTFSGPLSEQNNVVTLNIGSGLIVLNDVLQTTTQTITYEQPLKINGTEVQLSFTSPLGITSNGELCLLLKPPFSVDGSGNLTLMLGPELAIDNNHLFVQLAPNGGLTTTTSGLSTSVTAPVTLSNGHITLKYGNGLSVDNTGTLVATGTLPNVLYPLEIANNNITLRYATPLYLDKDAKLNLKTAIPFSVVNDNLQLNYTYGLALLGQNLTVSYPAIAMTDVMYSIDRSTKVTVMWGSASSLAKIEGAETQVTSTTDSITFNYVNAYFYTFLTNMSTSVGGVTWKTVTVLDSSIITLQIDPDLTNPAVRRVTLKNLNGKLNGILQSWSAMKKI